MFDRLIKIGKLNHLSLKNFVVGFLALVLLVFKILLSVAQVANTRTVGQIRPSTLFYPVQHLVSTQLQCRAPA